MEAVKEIFTIWAKSPNSGSPRFHPLVCHLVDVLAVSRSLWRGCFTDSLRSWLATQLGVDHEPACQWIAFWAALHDLGKASPGFQGKWPQARASLEARGFDFRPLALPAPHGTATAATLPRYLDVRFVSP